MKNKILLTVGLFSFALLLAMSSCKSHKNTSPSGSESNVEATPVDTLLVMIKREACFGRCPQYYATVYKSGFAEYYGEMNVKKIGQWYARLSSEQLAYLVKAISDNKIEAMDTSYSNPYLADFPVYSLWIADKNPRKKILLNHESPPVPIIEFTQVFEELLDQLRWDHHPKARKDEE
ncbi:MAG: hypothetical protein IPJ26_06225 [Bacteroidetes bacterium]|nr:hypothetical protein [Bacteroidota bacterium]